MLDDIHEELAYMLYQLIEGDVVENALSRLEELGFVDESHEWIYSE